MHLADPRNIKMFRRVDLPGRIRGKLLLHSMPGRFERIDRVWQQVESEAVGVIVCLVEPYEINLKSSAYAAALEAGAVPCPVLPFSIREGGMPDDREGFWTLANDVADRLQSGEAVLIHCAGGAGRTAMLAVSVLLALGEPMNEAENAVSRAGSIVETMPQIEMLSWCAARASRDGDNSDGQ
jgi:protein-tyrosine phosphatase